MRTHVWAIKLTALSLAIIALPVARGPAPAAAAPPAPLSCHSGILRGLRCASWRVDPFMAIVWPFFYDFAGIFISFFFFAQLLFLHPASFNTHRKSGRKWYDGICCGL